MHKYSKLFAGIMVLFILWIGTTNCLKHFAREDSELSKNLFVLQTDVDAALITHVNTGKEKLAALTFDDGPDPRYTSDVLDILKRYDVKATFFVVGENAMRYPFLVQRQIRDGHEVENHTMTHPDLNLKDPYQTNEEIFMAEEVIRQLTDRSPLYFRPPKKLFTDETVIQAQIAGYRVVLWTICVENQRAKTAEQMARRIIRAAKPGVIILAHDGRMDRSKTVKALPLIIKRYQEMGYHFVTMEELIAAELAEKD